MESSQNRWYYGDQLQQLCIDSIVDNFDLLMRAWEENSTLQFEFLKRKFSQLLFELLTKRKLLRESHLPFLMNPFIHDLDLSYYQLEPLTIIPWVKFIGYNIKRISFKGQSWKKEILLEIIRHTPYAEKMEFHGTETTNSVLKSLGEQCPLLKELGLLSRRHNFFQVIVDFLGKDEFGNIKKNNTLQSVYFDYSSIQEDCVEHLIKNATELRCIEPAACPMAIIYRSFLTKTNESAFPKYNIQRLSFSYLTVEEFPMQRNIMLVYCAVSCPNIKELCIDDKDPLDEQLFNALILFKKLEELVLENESEELVPFDHLARFLTTGGHLLRKLSLTKISVDSKQLANYCPNLETLSLTGGNFENLIREESDCFSNLYELTIEVTDETVESVAFLLNNSPDLKHLQLRGQYITSIHSTELHVPISVDTANVFRNCRYISGLKCLDLVLLAASENVVYTLFDSAIALEDVLIGEETMRERLGEICNFSRSEYPHVRKLTCRRVNSHNVAAVMSLVSKCPRLEVLDFNLDCNSGSTKEKLLEVTDELKECRCIRNLRYIDFYLTEVDIDHTEIVAKLKESAPRLKELNFENRLGLFT